MQHHGWMNETKPWLPPSQEAIEVLNKGFMYLHKRDKRGRVNVILDVQKLTKMDEAALDRMTPAVNFMLTYSINTCQLPSKAETWNMIIDLTDVSFSQIPRKKLQAMMGQAQTNFRGRAYKIFVCNAGLVMRGSFKIIKAMLDEFTAQKIKVMGEDF